MNGYAIDWKSKKRRKVMKAIQPARPFELQTATTYNRNKRII